MNQVAERKNNTLPAEAKHMDAMTLVSQAVSNGAQVEQVDKLIELVKFNDQREALRAFNQAFTLAQADFPTIAKTKKAHNSNYAPLDEIVKAMRPVLQKHGFSFRHSVSENTDKSVTVSCILAHQDGHSEAATLTGPSDSSGSKNAIQAIGSTVTYLRRYTFEAVTGLVTGGSDDDGNAASDGGISAENLKELEALRSKLDPETQGRFDKWIKQKGVDSLADLPPGAYASVKKQLEKFA